MGYGRLQTYYGSLAVKELVSNANHEGGLYGLLGLRILKSEAFPLQLGKYRLRQAPLERIVSAIKVPAAQVVTMRGCFILRVGWTETLSQLESGSFDEDFVLRQLH